VVADGGRGQGGQADYILLAGKWNPGSLAGFQRPEKGPPIEGTPHVRLSDKSLAESSSSSLFVIIPRLGGQAVRGKR
jgi:hypothetical protein